MNQSTLAENSQTATEDAVGGTGTDAALLRSRAVTITLGAVTAILMRSPEHRDATLRDLEALVMPPLGLDQVAIAEARDAKTGAVAPVAMALWALVSDEVDRRLADPTLERPRLTPADWNGGTVPWIIAVAGQKTAAARLLEQLVKTRFTARPPKIRLTRKDGTIAVGIVETGSQHAHRHEGPDGPA